MSIIENIKLQLGEGPVPKKKKPDKFIDTMAEMDAAIAKMMKASAKAELVIKPKPKKVTQPKIVLTATKPTSVEDLLKPGYYVKVAMPDGFIATGVLTDVAWTSSVGTGTVVEYEGQLLPDSATTKKFSGSAMPGPMHLMAGDTLELGIHSMKTESAYAEYVSKYASNTGSTQWKWDHPVAKQHADADLSQITADLEKLPQAKGVQGYSIGGPMKWDDPKMSLQAYQHEYTFKTAQEVDPEKALSEAFSNFMKEVQYGFATGKFKFPAGEHALGAMGTLPPTGTLYLGDSPVGTTGLFKKISLTLKEE